MRTVRILMTATALVASGVLVWILQGGGPVRLSSARVADDVSELPAPEVEAALADAARAAESDAAGKDADDVVFAADPALGSMEDSAPSFESASDRPAPADVPGGGAEDGTDDVTGAGAAVIAAPDAPATDPVPKGPDLDLVRVEPDGRTQIAGRAMPGEEVLLRLDGVEVGRADAGTDGTFFTFLALGPSASPRALSVEYGSGGVTTLMLQPAAARIVASVADTSPEEGRPANEVADERARGEASGADPDASIAAERTPPESRVPGADAPPELAAAAGAARIANADPDRMAAAPGPSDSVVQPSGSVARGPTPGDLPRLPERGGAALAAPGTANAPGVAPDGGPTPSLEASGQSIPSAFPSGVDVAAASPGTGGGIASSERASGDGSAEAVLMSEPAASARTASAPDAVASVADQAKPSASDAPAASPAAVDGGGAREDQTAASSTLAEAGADADTDGTATSMQAAADLEGETGPSVNSAPDGLRGPSAASSTVAQPDSGAADPASSRRREAAVEVAKALPASVRGGRPAARGAAARFDGMGGDGPEARVEPSEPLPPKVLVSDAGGVRLLQAPPLLRGLELDTIAYGTGGAVEVTGRADASESSSVRVYVDGRPVLNAPTGPDGAWSGALDDVAAGTYTLRVDALDAAGNVTRRVELPFQRETPETAAAAGPTVVTVQPGNTLWGIARETYGDGFLYVRVFEANKNAIRDPDLIYPGQIFDVPTSGERP